MLERRPVTAGPPLTALPPGAYTPPIVTVGNVVTYRITVTNHGPYDASRVVLDDRLPKGAALLSTHPDVEAVRRGGW